MAKPRNPLGKAKVEGRDKINAGRYKTALNRPPMDRLAPLPSG